MPDVFDIDEILPGEAAGSVRLPRQQAGSPQGLAVTLITDYTLTSRAWLPSSAIVDLLTDFGVTTGAARTTISRLARRGVIENKRDGRYSSYRLTEGAALNLSAGGKGIAAFASEPDSWDGRWTVVAFSAPQDDGTLRRNIRYQLRWRGYAPLYDGLWVSPHPMTAEEQSTLASMALETVSVFRADWIDLKSGGAQNPVDAWDVDAIARQYREFIRRWKRKLPGIAEGRVTGSAAVRARTEVMDTYRRFPVLDPLLPAKLMPQDWPREQARDTFVAVYDGLAERAEQYVRGVIARSEDGPHPEIRAHTVAEMAAGI